MPVVIQPTLTRTANGQDMYLPIADAEGAPGVLQLLAGSGITLDPPTGSGVVTVTASGGGGGGGVTSVTGGAGISATPTTGAVVLANTGVTKIFAGTGISVSGGGTGEVSITNTSGSGTGFQTFTMTQSTPQTFAVTGKCGVVEYGYNGGGTQSPVTQVGSGGGWALVNIPILSNPSWNAKTLVLVSQTGMFSRVSGGAQTSYTSPGLGVVPGNYITQGGTPDYTTRAIVVTGTGPEPSGIEITRTSFFYVVIQGE